MESFEYQLAWGLYIVLGLGLCLSCWVLTAWMKSGSREILVGLVAVMVFTPWYAGEIHDHYAPALLVLFFDVLFVKSDEGFGSGIALVAALSFLFVVLAVRQLLTRSKKRSKSRL